MSCSVPKVDYSTQLDPINGLFVETAQTVSAVCVCAHVCLDTCMYVSVYLLREGRGPFHPCLPSLS